MPFPAFPLWLYSGSIQVLNKHITVCLFLSSCKYSSNTFFWFSLQQWVLGSGFTMRALTCATDEPSPCGLLVYISLLSAACNNSLWSLGGSKAWTVNQMSWVKLWSNLKQIKWPGVKRRGFQMVLMDAPDRWSLMDHPAVMFVCAVSCSPPAWVEPGVM